VSTPEAQERQGQAGDEQRLRGDEAAAADRGVNAEAHHVVQPCRMISKLAWIGTG
jgi:hypothetical protein